MADELIDRLEARAQGSAVYATGSEIQKKLYELGPVTYHSYRPTKSLAGQRYQSLWTPDSYPTTFGQQWVSFVCVSILPYEEEANEEGKHTNLS